MKKKKSGNWLIYGANGYTGKLILDLCKEKGLNPVIAGRNPKKIEELAREYGFEWKAFSLDNHAIIVQNIEEFELVLHCAGPFIKTAEPMAKACIESSTHYLDITGEIPVYDLLHKLGKTAEKAKTLLLPGVGFDIVPTDCAAAMVKRDLPDAAELAIAFMGLGGISAGTAKSALAQAPEGSKIRKSGRLITVPQLSLTKVFRIAGQEREMVSIPWGDVFTAYISTGIPDIAVYTYMPSEMIRIGKLFQFASPLLRNPTVLSLAQSAVGVLMDGPNEKVRESGKTFVVAIGRTAKGKTYEIGLESVEGYKFTALSAVLSVQKILKKVPGYGFFTPSLALGPDFVLEIPGTRKSNG
jgi:short subunit dehydrogenase-like uncharacterized protein